MRSPPFFIPLVLGILLATGCDKAQRIKATAPAKESKPPSETPAVPAHYGWMETETGLDFPLVFVPATDPAWQQLPDFWKAPLHPATLHLGQTPLGVFVALRAVLPRETVKIKVPLGLPDPNPRIPAANPPTLMQWHLGKDLFHEPMLRVGGDTLSCASCHVPGQGFTEKWPTNLKLRINALSLLNSVYNRRQFWDGRVGDLEEVLVRELDDERPTADRKAGGPDPIVQHVWGGLVRKLSENEPYRARFQRIFGIIQPTQDTIAKVLATYMRTLLSGNSLYDQAEALRLSQKDSVLSAKHLAPLLIKNKRTLKELGLGKMTASEAADEWEKGLKLFQGKGRCATCHHGPLFTDQDYHNIGIMKRDEIPLGRFAHAPVGQKESRLMGAFRTPTLRNLPRTGPYFHDGSRPELRDVVKYYNDALIHNRHLAKVFVGEEDQAVSLGLTVEEVETLVLFLRSLEGEPLDAVVARSK